jgi:transcriptional regulator with XRE-family HTH domain
MDPDQRRRIGSRILVARREAGLTQRELAELLGITTRSVQNYESGAVMPWRHLARIETLTRKRRGWLTQDDATGGSIDQTIADLLEVMEKHHAILQDHLRVLRLNTERLREQREALRTNPVRSLKPR